MSVEVCLICPAEFPSEGAMRRHMSFEHPREYAALQAHEAEQRAAARQAHDEAHRITDAMRSDLSSLSPWDLEALQQDQRLGP